MSRPVACVTGGTGMIGSYIVDGLVSRGFLVRMLSRKNIDPDRNVQIFRGGLGDAECLARLMHGAQFVFHCAAELNDERTMHEVNVEGTRLVVHAARSAGITYFCHLSSVGVIGRTCLKTVDETTPCSPQNEYEKSKLESEKIVASMMEDYGAVILRPTNVVDETHPGILSLPERGSLSDRLKVFLTGRECAHLVHARNVAAAALFFIDRPFERVERYIVSCDGEPMDTLSELWPLYKAFRRGESDEKAAALPGLPLAVPYILRKILRGTGNMGDVRYSARKLLDAGFVFPLGLKETVRRIAEAHCSV